MKWVRLFLLAAVTVFVAAGCSGDETTIASNDPPNPDVVIPYSAPSTTAEDIVFEDVSAKFKGTGTSNSVEFEGYIRNVGSETKEFSIKVNFKEGDIAIAGDKDASIDDANLDPGMKSKFIVTLTAKGHTQGTVTYWGLDGTKTTQKYTLGVP